MVPQPLKCYISYCGHTGTVVLETDVDGFLYVTPHDEYKLAPFCEIHGEREAWRLNEVRKAKLTRRHLDGDHHREAVSGCPYCYPPGPDGMYRASAPRLLQAWQ